MPGLHRHALAVAGLLAGLAGCAAPAARTATSAPVPAEVAPLPGRIVSVRSLPAAATDAKGPALATLRMLGSAAPESPAAQLEIVVHLRDGRTVTVVQAEDPQNILRPDAAVSLLETPHAHVVAAAGTPRVATTQN